MIYYTHIAILMAKAMINHVFAYFPLHVQVLKPFEKLQDPKLEGATQAEFGRAGISSFDDLMKKGGYEYSRSTDKAGCCSCSSWES